MKEFHNEGVMPPTFENNNLSLPTRMRAWLSRREPSIGYVAEARVLLREALAELERLQKLASPVWPEEPLDDSYRGGPHEH